MLKKLFASLFTGTKLDSDLLTGEQSEPNGFESLCVNLQAREWEDFFMPELFQKWASDLKSSIALKNYEVWQLTGRAVIVLSQTHDLAKQLLARVANDAGMNFYEVPNSLVTDLLPNGRKKFENSSPAIVLLEAGDWMSGASDPHAFSPFGDEGSSFTKSFRIDLSTFNADKPVIFVTAVKSERSISSDLKKVGAFDRIIAIDKPTPDFLGSAFIRKVGASLLETAALQQQKKIGLLLQSEFETEDQQNLLALRIQRLAKNESRKITFNDLATLALRGMPEHSQKNQMTFQSSSRRKTALHEAGHACIAIIASGGTNVPDYATVVPSKNFEGVVYESLSYYDKMEDFTYNNMLLKTRVFLAGRAAEDLFYGSANVSSGANSDLAAATQMCFSLFAYSGFNSDMATAESSAHNLAVLSSSDVDPVQYDRISREVRSFLQEQYKYVLTTLEENRPFVESVADRLLWDPVVDQSEMIELATRFGLNAHPE